MERLTQNRYVVFDLPFAIRIRDSLSLSKEAPPAPAKEMYVGLIPPCGLSLIMVMAKPEGHQGFHAKGEIEGGDLFGRWSYSRIQVRYHCPTSREVRTWPDHVLIANAVSAANVLIRHYRDLADQALLRELSANDVVHFRIVEEYAENESEQRWSSTGRGPLQFGIDEQRLRLEHELRLRVQTDAAVEFLRELHLGVIRHADSGDFRVAVIEMAALFEAWLRRFLSLELKDRGLSREAISSRFRRPNGSFMTVSEIADAVVRDVLGFDFFESEAGREWRVALRDVRNELIHGGRETVTREEATRALIAGRDAKAAIEAHRT